ncbi:hypothetical protein [Pseudoalteromonas sp. Of7M-16]|uniref:hypothetical protein n=1 Tax=Pseudoalteromonas sp. Of7M-16 TaxID=2917756 RepID=UPI001EF5D18E|nr:hypothetical protein [Pseudoalteromonas sp. Of7M-16]MCG7550507.1 hypothetical protein [Pseudoalteromonas sp. Of7M-16]
MFASNKAKFWQAYYSFKNKVAELKASKNYSVILNASIIFLCFSTGVSILYSSQDLLFRFFFERESFLQFRSTILGIGGSLIGATSIAFTFLIFSLQNNLDKLPHGLFRKAGVDSRLIFYYLVSVMLALSICFISLFPDYRYVMVMLSMLFISVSTILIMFILAYKRTLIIVNPTFHLGTILTGVIKNHRMWDKAFNRSKSLIEVNESPSNHNYQKVKYLSIFPNWSKPTIDGIKHSILLARAFKAKGDLEVCEQALSTILNINIDYISTKENTFFTVNPFIDNPLSSDPIINYTLEEVRQNINIGITTNDEQFVMQNIRLLHSLALAYYNIDYSDQRASKWHSHLATGYITSAIDEQCIPNKLVDVTLESIRLLGNIAQVELAKGDIENITTISNKISTYASIGAINEKFRCITQVGIEQISKLMFKVITSGDYDIKIISKVLTEDIAQVARFYIKSPEVPFSNYKSQCLGDYFTGSSQTSFLQLLTHLCNHISDQDNDPDEKIKETISRISQWASESYSDIKDLFIESLQKKSSFACDLTHWLEHVVKCLLFVSQSPHTSVHDKDELLKSINWLTHIFSWVPNEEDAVRCAESYQMTDVIFSIVREAYKFGMHDTVTELKSLLLSWGKKASFKGKGWQSLERAISGYLILDLLENIEPEVTSKNILKLFEGNSALDNATRASLLTYLNKQASDYHRNHYSHSQIEYSMSQVDSQKLTDNLHSIIEQLSK